MIWALKNQKYEIEIQAFEKEASQFDTRYFGYIKILNYRTWCFFTESQISHLKTLFELVESQEKLTSYNSGVHYSKAKAHKEKYYLNTWLFHFVSVYPKENHRHMRSNFFSDYLIRPWKTAGHWSWYLTDRDEVIFKEKTFWTQKRLGKMLLFETYPKVLDECHSFQDLMTKLTPVGADKGFVKEFQTFFVKNKFRKEKYHDRYAPNFKLVSTCVFLAQTFSMDEIKNFKTYKKLICYVFANPSAFEVEKKDRSDWTYCFNTLAGKNRVSSFLKWHFYFDHAEKMKDILEKLAHLNLPYEKHKDPVYAFNFYSKRYCQDIQPNFSFLHPNHTDYHDLTNKLDEEVNELFSIKKIQDYNELHATGAALHNCAGNLETLSGYLRCLTFKVTDNRDGRVYLGTVNKGIFSQFKGFKNSSPPLDLFQAACKHLVKNKILREDDFEFNKVCVQSYR